MSDLGPDRPESDDVADQDELIGAIAVPSDSEAPADADSDVALDLPRRESLSSAAQELNAYLAALDLAADAARSGTNRAVDSCRRLAQAVAASPTEGLDGDLRLAAEHVAPAPADELLGLVDQLRERIRTHLEQHTSEAEIGGITRVLVVDDDPIQARLLEGALRNADRVVQSVSTVADARAVIDREEVHLVVVDRVLGDADGHDLLVHVRAQPALSNVPMIVLSSHAEDADVSEAYALGADAYFSKDTSPRVLASAVSAHLHRSAERRMSVLRDPDTGVRSRTVFIEAYQQEARLSTRRGVPLTVAMLSVDRFRHMVDCHGPDVGRKIVGTLANAISGTIRGSDIAGRWSQDVFGLALPDTDIEGARLALTKVWKDLADRTVSSPSGTTLTITASAGVAGLWEAYGDIDVQIERALKRLAAARRAGRGNVALNDEAFDRSDTPILLIEDDELTAELIRHRLEREGFELIHFKHGADALADAPALEVALAIVDVSMPGANGYEILLKLRATGSYAGVPILMMTQGTEAQTARAFRLGATDVLRKPFAPSELIARVNRLVSAS